MAGLLLSTGTPGSEGTLGGLVDQGHHLIEHLRGPSAVDARAIGTSEALTELFQRATRGVLLAGYAFDHGERILEPLHAAMLRGAVVELYMHVDEARDDEPEAAAKVGWRASSRRTGHGWSGHRFTTTHAR
jgi:hypothetical protein